MKKLVLPLAVLLMAAMILGAFSLDCVRLAAAASQRVAEVDDELAKHESRLVKLLAASPKLSPEVQAAIREFESAAGPAPRRAAYEKVLAEFRRTMSDQIDPTNPLDRRFMDDVSGAINRHVITRQQLEIEQTAYNDYLSGRRGEVARWFSDKARQDFAEKE